MARPRKKNSKYPLGGLGLKPEEDDRLIELLDTHDISIRQLCRALVRQWMVEGGEGVLKYYSKK
jgi:hypothetical protein